ncbi:hypothetical protein V8C86DRAFT_2727889 [Haematococcus lacustris]
MYLVTRGGGTREARLLPSSGFILCLSRVQVRVPRLAGPAPGESLPDLGSPGCDCPGQPGWLHQGLVAASPSPCLPDRRHAAEVCCSCPRKAGQCPWPPTPDQPPGVATVPATYPPLSLLPLLLRCAAGRQLQEEQLVRVQQGRGIASHQPLLHLLSADPQSQGHWLHCVQELSQGQSSLQQQRQGLGQGTAEEAIQGSSRQPGRRARITD